MQLQPVHLLMHECYVSFSSAVYSVSKALETRQLYVVKCFLLLFPDLEISF